jgi:hypothetical protein
LIRALLTELNAFIANEHTGSRDEPLYLRLGHPAKGTAILAARRFAQLPHLTRAPGSTCSTIGRCRSGPEASTRRRSRLSRSALFVQNPHMHNNPPQNRGLCAKPLRLLDGKRKHRRCRRNAGLCQREEQQQSRKPALRLEIIVRDPVPAVTILHRGKVIARSSRA